MALSVRTRSPGAEHSADAIPVCYPWSVTISLPACFAIALFASGVGILWEIHWDRQAILKKAQAECRHTWGPVHPVAGSRQFYTRHCFACKKMQHVDENGKPTGPDA